jgi:hypothetical protein
MVRGLGGIWNIQSKKCMQTFCQKSGKEELSWGNPGVDGKKIFKCILKKQILQWIVISGGRLRTQ